MLKLITPVDTVDTTQQFTIGSRAKTKDGNVYIYLPGTTSVAKYDWVIFVTTTNGLSYGSVTRLTATDGGPVAIAQGAIISNTFGWFLIDGVGWASAGEAVSAGSPLYASGTTALVGTTVAAISAIYGAYPQTAGISGGTFKAQIRNPYLYGQTI
jgi:hypothetical protein